MTHKLGVQVARMVRRLQRPAEIVHRENVFQEFRLLEIADAPGLPRGIELVGHSIRARVEIMIVFGFIDPHAPKNNARVIPVAPDHSAHVVDGN